MINSKIDYDNINLIINIIMPPKRKANQMCKGEIYEEDMMRIKRIRIILDNKPLFKRKIKILLKRKIITKQEEYVPIKGKDIAKYCCELHDNDIEICNMYECEGEGKCINNEEEYNYIN